MKLAHLADLHLGFRQFDRSTPKGGNQREADVAEAFRRAVDDLLEQRPDLVVIAGDVFHAVRPTNPAILFLFQQLQRLRVALPDTPVVMIAGNHDTPRSSETGTILKLYAALGVEVVSDAPRRIAVPRLDCAVLAVPHQALMQGERPALRPERGAQFNILVLHGELPGLGEERGTMEYGGAVVRPEELGSHKWDYVALGHYNVAHQVADNAWYSGSLEYLPPNPWGQLEEERDHGLAGKCYLLVELPGAQVTKRHITPVRRHLELPVIRAAGLAPKEIDHEIAQRIATARPAIDGQVARLVVYDVPRTTARDLDHAAIRAFKARALHLQLDLRRPEERRHVGVGGPGGRRQTVPEVVREFLSRRLLDGEIDRDEFVRLGVEYVETAGRGTGDGGGAA